jgi:hypothetical protein
MGTTGQLAAVMIRAALYTPWKNIAKQPYSPSARAIVVRPMVGPLKALIALSTSQHNQK